MTKFPKNYLFLTCLLIWVILSNWLFVISSGSFDLEIHCGRWRGRGGDKIKSALIKIKLLSLNVSVWCKNLVQAVVWLLYGLSCIASNEAGSTFFFFFKNSRIWETVKKKLFFGNLKMEIGLGFKYLIVAIIRLVNLGRERVVGYSLELKIIQKSYNFRPPEVRFLSIGHNVGD